MNQPPEEFENLRKLLAWKRHESPPPGYFDALSGQVMRRLEETDSKPISCWDAIRSSLNPKPILAGAYAACVLGLAATAFTLSAAFDRDAPSAALFASTAPLAVWSATSDIRVFGDTRAEMAFMPAFQPGLRPDMTHALVASWSDPSLRIGAGRFERLDP